MSTVLVISGSPSLTSKTEILGDHVTEQLADCETSHLRIRTLPARQLLSADTTDPAIAEAREKVARADGIVLATPTYKASYSGLLKVFLDLLPQSGFAGKAVLPLATGGSAAHVLVLDYALRPVAQSLGARHVVQGFFLLDQFLDCTGERPRIGADAEQMLDEVVGQFRRSLIPALAAN